jgi:hypothetical protein
MKKITITIVSLIIITPACKKDNNESGHKCSWNVILNNRVAYEWLEKPTPALVKIIGDSCSCIINVNEICFPCNTSVTTAGGIDVPCR